MNLSSPSFSEIELTIGLPCIAFQAGLDDPPLGESTMTGTGDVGFARDQVEEPVHGGDAVDHAFVHVDVDDLGAVLDLLRGHPREPVS